MRTSTAALLAAGLCLWFAAGSAASQEGPRWANVSTALVSTESVRSATPHGRNLSVLFDSLRVNLQSAADSMSATRIASFQAVVEGIGSPRWVHLAQQVRGYVVKDENARVVIVLDLGQTVQVREYPYGRRLDSPIVRSLPGRVRLLPGQRYNGRIIVYAERRTPDADVLVDIDSYDAIIAPIRP
jgi:hypothetical protein